MGETRRGEKTEEKKWRKKKKKVGDQGANQASEVRTKGADTIKRRNEKSEDKCRATVDRKEIRLGRKV